MSSSSTAIQWTDRTWNPVRGCSRVSPGCDNCYAMNVAHRFAGEGRPYEGLTTLRKGKVDWSGVARFVPSALDEPLHWRKPARIFVNSMSDLFHHSVTNEEIAAVFGVMAASPRHTFQVLTKRAERMRGWFEWVDEQAEEGELSEVELLLGYAADHLKGPAWSARIVGIGPRWPLHNCWLGVSAEDQQRADERIPHLLATPAAVRFVSAEPLLGAIDLRNMAPDPHCGINTDALTGQWAVPGRTGRQEPRLHWVIVGGESGPGARPCEVGWIRDVVEQCRESGIPCFVKQLGANIRDRNDAGFDGEDGDAWDLKARLFDRGVIEHDPDGIREDYQGAPVRVRLRHSKGGDPSEWPADLRVREFPEASP